MSEALRKTILQILMSKPYVTINQLDRIIQPLHTNREEFIQSANNSLSPLGLELRRIVSDYDDIEYVGVCEIYEDINGKESLGIRPEVVQLFYKFLDLIINSAIDQDCTVTVGQLMDLSVGLSQVQIQDGLVKLKECGYIDIVNDKVRIGPRGLLEFRPKFSQKAADGEEGGVRMCGICLDFVLAGKKCTRCTCCMHKRCYEGLVGNRTDVPCPSCKCKEQFEDFGF